MPLGPFNAKNFGSTLSPWVITPEALDPFKIAIPAQEPKLLDYLQDSDLGCYDIDLRVSIKASNMDSYHQISHSNMKYLYYSVA